MAANRIIRWSAAAIRGCISSAAKHGPERTDRPAWLAHRQPSVAHSRPAISGSVGTVAAIELRLAGNEAEVSYNVTAELRRQGIAPRALQAFLTWAAQQIGLRAWEAQ